MLSLLILINFLFYKLNALLPRVDYGGCTIIEDKLYYLSGNTYSPRTDYFLKQNHEVFILNLKKGFKLLGNVAPWERNNTINSPESQSSPSLFYIGSEGKQKIVVSFHYDLSVVGLISNYFDIESNRWYKEDVINKLYSKVNVSNIDLRNHFQRYYVLQDEKDLNQFYISGSFRYNNSQEDTSLQLNSFNIKTKELKTIYKTSKKVFVELKFILNNKLYYFEMTTENNRELIYANKILYELDLKSNDIESYNLNTNLMYFDLTFIKANQSIYFIGLKDMNKRIIDIYEFKFNPFSFKKINRQINPFNHWGCFTSYNSYIINSFGHQFGSINTGIIESTDKMLILDTKTWETVDGLPSLIEEKEESIKITNDSNKENNINNNKNLDNNKLLIGEIISGISGIILITIVIVFLYYKYKMKKEKPVSMIIEPILIKPINPLDINNNYYNAEIFSHSHEIDDNATMLPLKTYIKSNKNNFT